MDLKLQVLRTEVKCFANKSLRLKVRLLALIELAKNRKLWGRIASSDFDRIALRFEISGRTLQRWERAYQRGGVKALTPKKAPGKKQKFIRGHTAKKICEYRKLYNWGAEVIGAHLKQDYGISLSRDRIERFLKKKKLFFRKKCKTKAPKKQHTTVVKVDHPGQHTQTDVKHLPHLLENEKKCYVYNFVDHASKWSYKKAFDSYGPMETRSFVEEVIAAAPFTIVRWQTDNGIEFTNKFVSHLDEPKKHALDEICEKNGIRHVLVPPGEKELQGLVERSHRQDDEELYHRIKPKNLEEFNKILSKHCEWRNIKRRRKSLGWRTSNQFLADYKKQIELWLFENGPSPFLLAKNPEEANNEFSGTDFNQKAA